MNIQQLRYDLETLKGALMRACERIADGPQEYHEAKTAEDWYDYFLKDEEDVPRCSEDNFPLDSDGTCLACAWSAKR